MDSSGWRDDDWIGRGLIYQQFADLPVVKRREQRLLEIPEAFRNARALPDLSVKALLRRLEPVTQGIADPGLSGAMLFSMEMPNVGLEQMLKALVLPPNAILEEMWKNFGQNWFNGVRSIKDFTDQGMRYPLPALAVYREFARAERLRKEWSEAEDWMMRGKHTPGLAETVAFTQRLMFAFPWNAELRALYTSVPFIDLLGMLRDGRKGWLSDSHVDMLMQLLTDRLERDYEVCEVLIAPCCFQHYILAAYQHRNDEKRRNFTLLNQYKDAFLSGRKRRLFFIGNINGCHWIPWMFVHEETPLLGHGDSLRMSEGEVGPLKNALMWWISDVLGSNTKCTYSGNILEHGDQLGETDSCGIVSYNAIAHALFGDELWSLRARKQHRIEAFNAIVMRYNAHQSSSVTEDHGLQVPPDSYRVADPPSCTPQSTIKTSSKASVELHGSEIESSSRKDMAIASSSVTEDHGLQVPPDSYRVADSPSCTPQFTIETSSEASVELHGSEIELGSWKDMAIASISALAKDASQGQELQVPLDSHGVANPPSCALDELHAINELDTGNDMQDDAPDDECHLDSTTTLSSSPEDNDASLQEKSSAKDAEHFYAKRQDGVASAKPPISNKRPREAMGIEPDEVNANRREKKRNTYDEKGTLFAFFGRTGQTGHSKISSREGTNKSMKYKNIVTRADQRGHELVVGVSKSAINSRKLREALISGTFTPNDSYLHTFKAEIRNLDARAQFRPEEWKVQHSKCRGWVKMKSAYSVSYFEVHIQHCKISSTLHDFAFSNATQKSTDSRANFPCSGLSSTHDPRIETYLLRPSALGGGGRSKISIAKEQFRKTYSELNKRRKKHVDKLQEDSWIWIVKHRYNAVFSTSCVKSVSVDADTGEGRTCGPCLSLLSKKSFRDAIRVPEPQLSNLKFVNRPYQHDELGIKFAKCKGVQELLDPKDDRTRVAVRYAKGVAEGKFKEHDVFTGLVNVVLQRLDRKERGKQMTNFKYPPAFDEFIQTVFLVCPRAHRLLAAHFPVRSDRSLRHIRAKEPQFVGGISPRSFELADKFVSALNVPNRIVALSADDTKLLPTFRPFFDREDGCWHIVGGTGDPLLVIDPDKLREELEEANLQKATKVRIWAIIVPLPKIPPIVLAALAITDKMSASEITQRTRQVIDGLHEKNIWPISYACDGTEKERANQRNLLEEADTLDNRTIRAPSPLLKDLKISIPIYHGKAVALVQDSQHAKKTLRNNLESGTKTLVLGNYTASYDQLREMAFDEKSPLYHRDVENTDKQDDRAAARVYSSQSLSWFITYRPDSIGIQVYLFIGGELCDAWQNRSISHIDRLRSILRSHYFVEIWLLFLQDAGYSIQKHCISREALDITSYLVKSYIALLIIYRDYLNGTTPLVPWLHSSEVCEHVFGELRKEVKDFDFATCLHFIPKVHSVIRYTMGLGDISSSDAKERARGYAHTWVDTEGLSLANLRDFPTDQQIDEIVEEAYKDATDLWEQLGLHPEDMQLPKQNTSNTNDVRVNGVSDDELSSDDNNDEDDEDDFEHLPSISEWYPDPHDLKELSERLPDDSDLSSVETTSRAVLEELLAREEKAYEHGPIRLDEFDNTMLNISCAKLLLDFDTSLRMDELFVTPTTDQWEQFFSEYAREVGNCFANDLPPILSQLRPPSNEAEVRLPPEQLLTLREAHETRFAKKAVRTTRTSATAAATTARNSEIQDSRARHSLIKKFSESLKQLQQDQGISTGLGRSMRWTNGVRNGNSANAVATAATRTAEAGSRRAKIYSAFNFPQTVSRSLSTGGFDEESPLRQNSFALVYVDTCILVGKVITLYTKSGGQNGRHSYIPEASNIGQLSYISMQTFEHTSNRFFRVIHSSKSHLRVRSFAHIPPCQLLSVLLDIPKETHNGNSIELSDMSFKLWRDLHKYSSAFSPVMREFRKRN